MKGSNLSYEDPFATAPADEEAQSSEENRYGYAPNPTNPAPAAKPAAVEQADGKVVLTFKGGRDFDAPWIVIHANSLEDAYEQVTVKAELLAKVMERTKTAGAHFAGGKAQAAPAQAAPQRQAPQGAQEAPGGEKRFCEHGEMVFKSGISKAGKPYKLFSCTAPRESQCRAQFLDG